MLRQRCYRDLQRSRAKAALFKVRYLATVPNDNKEGPVMSTLAIVGKLQRLLTKENIKQFDRVFEVLTDPSTHTYAVFWHEIHDKYPEFNDAVKGTTYRALLALRAILREYGGNAR
jgi:hypothetical protein